ncbi:MAG: hypothetical protein ACK5XR_19240, partial [Pseudanabaena sp.]
YIISYIYFPRSKFKKTKPIGFLGGRRAHISSLGFLLSIMAFVSALLVVIIFRMGSLKQRPF